jgi:V/A-type H+-transporting ATPase subunit I
VEGALQLPELEGFAVTRLAQVGTTSYWAVAGRGEFGTETLGLGSDVSEMRVPDHAPAEMRRLVDECERKASEADRELRTLVGEREKVRARASALQERVKFFQAREGMESSGAVTYLQGWLPVERIPEVNAAAAQHGWGVVFDEPIPGEPVPTLLRYSRWVSPIMSMFKLLGIYPGYWESDVGWTFLIFFSLFFGMLVGDAVYGTMLLIAAIVAGRKLKKAPRYVFGLLYMVSVTTIVWGVLTGNYLGIPNIPAPLLVLKVDWLSSGNNVMGLCFLIGVVHLTIAHIWNALEVSPRSKILAELGWIAILWFMFLLARKMVLNYALPSFAIYMLVAGMVAVILFMSTPREFKAGVINHALLPLTVISQFVDVLSYVRLYAVGFASVAIIEAFNMIASNIGFSSVLTAAASVLILVFAHTLNMVLAGLGVLIHAVRLNTLEFSTHKGIAWQGTLFEPFARRS